MMPGRVHKLKFARFNLIAGQKSCVFLEFTSRSQQSIAVNLSDVIIRRAWPKIPMFKRGGIMNVSITKITPTDTEVTVDWVSDTTVLNTAQFMVATSLQNLQAGTYVTVGDDSGNCPGNSFQASAPSATPYLNPGTLYYLQAVCDGTTSQSTTFSTLPDGATLGQPQSNPWIIKTGGQSTISVVVTKSGKPVANVPVTFTIPADAGSLNGQAAGTPVTVNTSGTGSAQVALTAGTKVGIFFTLASAAPYCTDVLHVPIVIY